jgi:transposase
MKILQWDGDGFWLHLKRLEKGSFNWPPKSAEGVLELTETELEYLIGGTKLTRKLRNDEVNQRKTA